MKLSGWLVVRVVIPSILFATTNGDFPSGAHKAVRCMLALDSPDDCAALPKVIMPSYLLQEYNHSPSSLHEALYNSSLAQLSEDLMSSIPLSLLYLIPRSRIADLKVNQLNAILLQHADDTSLVKQIAACLQLENIKWELFKKMNISVPEESLQILAESIEVVDLTENFLNLPYIEKEPLLAYLRPAVLFNVKTSTLHTIFNVLKMAESKQPKKSSFYFLAEAAIRHRSPLSKIIGFVMGLSSDQLLDESLSSEISVSDFKLDLSILQARALFERIFQKVSLSSSNFIDSKPLLYKLSPELLQKFPQNIQKYDVNYIEPTASIPLPTASQITEYVKADCILTRKLPKNEDEFWGPHIRHLGKWVYTLPLSALEDYKDFVLNTAFLKTLESPHISPIQAYYLSGKGKALDVMTPNSVLELETFLHALPASQLVNRKLGEISEHVKLHLVSKLPANNLARTLSLVNKIASSIGDPAGDDNAGDSSILEELLENGDVNQIMALLSPKDLALSADAMLNMFNEKRIRHSFKQTIEQLPQQILAALLEQDKLRDVDQWRWSRLLEISQISHLLVGGLTCQHIEDMDTGLFIPIMHRYNRIRKKSFPKNLQHCCLQKLMNHLKLKMTLSQADADLGLISLLEPIEIESVGGYVLVDIPLDAMQVSPYLGHILSKIGQLSNAELMLSTDISRLKQIAELAVDKEGNADTYLIRNLAWFLPPNTSTPDLRLMLEAGLLDTTLCLPAETRQDVANSLLSVFGPPEHWSAGVLATLQDLLIVFSDEELSNISQSAWTKAADSFTSHYDDEIEWVEPSAFYKVCASMLGKSEENNYKDAVGHYISWRLKAAQWLLATVVPVPQPEASKLDTTPTHNNYDGHDEEPKTILRVFDSQVDLDVDSEEDDDFVDEDLDTSEETSTVTTSTITSTEENASETSTTEKSTTEEITTEQITTEEISTEKSTTVTNISPESITKENVTEKSPSKVSLSEGTTDERTTKKLSSPNSQTHQKLSEEAVTLSSAQENTSTSRNLTTEAPVNVKIEKSKVSNINSTTQKPTNLNTTTSLIKNYDVSRDKSSRVEYSQISPESTTGVEKSINTPCINSVDKEDCQNTTSVSSNNITVNAITHNSSNSNTTSQIYPKPTSSILNNTSNMSSANQSHFHRPQNSSIKQSNLPLNQTKNTTVADKDFNKTTTSTTPLATEDKYSKNSEMPSSLFRPDIKTSPIESKSNFTFSRNENSTENSHSLEKNNTLQEDSQDKDTNNTIPTNNRLKGENTPTDVEDEEKIEDYDSKEEGLLDRRGKRNVALQSNDMKLSCNAVKMVGSLAELALTAADLEEMPSEEIADCRVEFGNMELKVEMQKIIWKKLGRTKLDGIHLLGRLLRVLSVADLWDINLRVSDPWVLENIHAIIQYNNSTMLVRKLLEEVNREYSEFSVDLLTVLGPAVCSVELSKMRALSVIGLDLGPSCPPCLPYLAQRATEELGTVNAWTSHFVHSLQAVVAGLDLDDWKKLATSYHKPLAGLQPSAARCLNTSHLEVLNPDQLRIIPTTTLLALSEDQLATLNSTQLETVFNITHPSINDKMTPTKRVQAAEIPKGNSSQVIPTASLLIYLTILHLLLTFKN